LTRADGRATDDTTIRPNPKSIKEPGGVSTCDSPAGGANFECYARTGTRPGWGQNREEQRGQIRVLQPSTVFSTEIRRVFLKNSSGTVVV